MFCGARADATEATQNASCQRAGRHRASRDCLILAWIERHRYEFSSSRESAWSRYSPAVRNLGPEEPEGTELDAIGWGEFQTLPFTRIFQARIPADCLRVVNLYAELNQGATLPGTAVAFASREGRASLLAVSRDTTQLDGNRARALRLLADRATYESKPPDSRERGELCDGLLSELQDSAPTRRGLAAVAVTRVAALTSPPDDRATKALTAAYKAERPGPARDAIAEALFDLVGPQKMATLAGRRDKSLALLRDLGLNGDKLFFWLALRAEPAAGVTETPTLFLDRMDAKGSVVETKKASLKLPRSSKSDGRNGFPLISKSHSHTGSGSRGVRGGFGLRA